MLRIDVLPAQRGDGLWLSYDHGAVTRHVLIDAGPQETIPTLVPELEQRIAAVPGRVGKIELFVITHIDADHIQGAVALLSDHRRVPAFRDVWFNGFRHLGLLGGPDGERLTAALAEHPDRWNAAFDHDAVVVPDDGPLPTRRLRGGLTITLLGPTKEALASSRSGVGQGVRAGRHRAWLRRRRSPRSRGSATGCSVGSNPTSWRRSRSAPIAARPTGRASRSSSSTAANGCSSWAMRTPVRWPPPWIGWDRARTASTPSS